MVKPYNAKNEDNYFLNNKNKNSTFDCNIEIISSDEEEDIKPLSSLLNIEAKKDLLKEELVVNNNITYIELLPYVSVNKKARIDHYNSNYQGVNISLDTINPKVKKENVNVTKTSANIGGESQGADLKKEFVLHEEELNQTEQIKNEYDESDSTIEWFRDLYSSDEDEEEDIKPNIPLSHLLKMELEKDLFKELRFG
ncbi:uncharacterized protein LOC132924720 [Rhopalosiphum padi]|uniref:uncharacterized protein LOC132924720 n=1 Tax=Rhopalosiphum padi TaxID=40932 RepID=UPI00298E4196|nr:uncharacterized protein LOC132924720 [Rhopalosiphum padi]